MDKVLFHILNRGVDKRTIFLDDRDYLRFVHNLFEFNDEQPTYSNLHYFRNSTLLTSDVDKVGIVYERPRKLLVELHAFALMPNHYHLLLSPIAEGGIAKFMKKINMGYAKYFNEKYHRSGALFQGKYKSVPIMGDPQFSYIPFYIHLNPLDLTPAKWRERSVKNTRAAQDFLGSYRWSSHLDYLGQKNFPAVTQRDFLFTHFDDETGYAKLFKQMLTDFSLEKVAGATLE